MYRNLERLSLLSWEGSIQSERRVSSLFPLRSVSLFVSIREEEEDTCLMKGMREMNGRRSALGAKEERRQSIELPIENGYDSMIGNDHHAYQIHYVK